MAWHSPRGGHPAAIATLKKLDMALIQWYERRVAITVKQLVETPHIGTRFHAGRAGGEQLINWAHSCEMRDPWDWLEPFDMLMTNGIGVPSAPHEQSLYIDQLADAGISAIAVGEGVGAPPISSAMVAASERRALPILLTAYEVPFAAVARVVAESRTDVAERRRLAKTARIYESLRAATIEHRDALSLLADLGGELGCSVAVLDVATWRHAFAPSERVAPATRALLDDTLRRCAGHLPAILRLDVDGSAALAVPVPSRRPAAMLASRFTESAPELSVLQHVSTVAALELEKLASQRDALSRSGGELLAQLLAGRMGETSAREALERFELTGELVLAAWSPPMLGDDRPIHQELYARGVPHLLRPGDRDHVALAVIDEGASARTGLLDALGEDCAVGLSAAVTKLGRLADAAREARWALHGAARGQRTARYGEDEPASWAFALERSEELAEHVLGPLLEYDRAHQTELIRTLAALLRNNRSPNPTAAELFIHRQTLVYRVRRIEELTERSLSNTRDVVDLWLALRAVEVSQGSILLRA
jgi:purine catabolism regulator